MRVRGKEKTMGQKQKEMKLIKKYLQIYEALRNKIVTGAIAYRQKLPSKRVTAEQWQASVVTVEHAYDILQSEGYIESRERSGYYACYRAGAVYRPQEASALPPQPAEPLGEEGLTFAQLAKTTRFVLNEYGEVLLQKSPENGVWVLRNAIRNYLARNRGIDVSEEDIFIGSGAEYLYGLLVELFPSGTVFGVESPAYQQIEKVYRAKNVPCETLPLGSDGIRSDALASTHAKVLHVTPFRSYPTGVSASASKKTEYLAWVAGEGRYLIEDDYASEFSLNGKIADTIFSMDPLHRVVYLNTFSKTICRSMRVGYMILPPKLAQRFREKLGFYSCTVPSLEQYLIATLLNDGTFERHVNKVRRRLKEAGR